MARVFATTIPQFFGIKQENSRFTQDLLNKAGVFS